MGVTLEGHYTSMPQVLGEVQGSPEGATYASQSIHLPPGSTAGAG